MTVDAGSGAGAVESSKGPSCADRRRGQPASGRRAATTAATRSLGRNVLRTNPSATATRASRWSTGVGAAQDEDVDAGRGARTRAMNDRPPSTSGRRGSRTTTSGWVSTTRSRAGLGLRRSIRRPRAGRRCRAGRTGSPGPGRRHRRGRHGRGTVCAGVGLHAVIVRRRGRTPERTFADVRPRPNDERRLRHPSRMDAALRRGRGRAARRRSPRSGRRPRWWSPRPARSGPRSAPRSCRHARASRPGRGGRPGRAAGSKPLPSSVIAQPDAARDPAELEPDLARPGVLDDVVERLLRDPVEDLLDRQRQALVERALDDDRQADPALERGRVRPQRAGQPVLLEVARAELEDERAHLGQRLALEVAQLDELGPGGGRDRGRAASRPSATRGSSRTAPGSPSRAARGPGGRAPRRRPARPPGAAGRARAGRVR